MKKIIFILSLICNLTFTISDCSSQWSQVNLPVTGTIHRMQFINQNTGWLTLSNNYMLRTTNGGINWSVITDSSSHVYYYQFINDTLGYSTGMNYLTPEFQKTTNGGVNWVPVYYPTPFALGSIFFVNANTGWADGFIFPGTVVIEKTTNGGQTFENVYTGAGSAGGGDVKLTMIKDSSSNEYYGYHYFNGHLYKTTNSGYNWTQMSFSNDLINYSFINKDTGWVVIRSTPRQILRTTNSGTNWISQYSDPSGVLSPSNIFASDNNNIWCGLENYYYKIIRTTNSGLNWGNQNCPIPWPQVVYMYDTSLGFAWNNFNNNNLVRTTNGGGQINSIQKISENVPNGYELKQNYPNPFNPSTNIEFQISGSATVYLQIFDILGRNVADIINSKEYSPGTYRVNFDMSDMNLSSGCYFYRLTVYSKGVNKPFTSTKKMIYNK